MNRKFEVERQAITWNDMVPMGAAVTYRRDDGSIISTRTRSIAQTLGDHTAVIFVEGIGGCVALDRVAQELSE